MIWGGVGKQGSPECKPTTSGAGTIELAAQRSASNPRVTAWLNQVVGCPKGAPPTLHCDSRDCQQLAIVGAVNLKAEKT
jgi:hypothetical protein